MARALVELDESVDVALEVLVELFASSRSGLNLGPNKSECSSKYRGRHAAARLPAIPAPQSSN
eukprot:9485246-Pyramimonas_sp.AAC.1